MTSIFFSNQLWLIAILSLSFADMLWLWTGLNLLPNLSNSHYNKDKAVWVMHLAKQPFSELMEWRLFNSLSLFIKGPNGHLKWFHWTFLKNSVTICFFFPWTKLVVHHLSIKIPNLSELIMNKDNNPVEMGSFQKNFKWGHLSLSIIWLESYFTLTTPVTAFSPFGILICWAF